MWPFPLGTQGPPLSPPTQAGGPFPAGAPNPPPGRREPGAPGRGEQARGCDELHWLLLGRGPRPGGAVQRAEGLRGQQAGGTAPRSVRRPGRKGSPWGPGEEGGGAQGSDRALVPESRPRPRAQRPRPRAARPRPRAPPPSSPAPRAGFGFFRRLGPRAPPPRPFPSRAGRHFVAARVCLLVRGSVPGSEALSGSAMDG